MADSFKLRCLKAVTQAFKEITPANGYQLDLSDFDPGDGVATARVYRGRAWFGDEDPVPLVSILEAVDDADLVSVPPVMATGGEYDWPLLVQGFVTDDHENPTDPAYVLLADLRQRLGVERKRTAVGSRSRPDPFGLGTGTNRITAVNFGSGIVRPADDVSAKAWVWLPVTLRIVEDSVDPYA